jgi:hypothetical protein
MAKHPSLGYHIEHSLSSVFFAAKMQESGFGIQEMGAVLISGVAPASSRQSAAKMAALRSN